MKRANLIGLVAAMLLAVAAVDAEERAAARKLISGPQAGEKVGSYLDFTGEKCGGGADRFKLGTKLRYY
jgi:hypothetical protein